MANSKDMMVENDLNLIHELHSSADHTALLYHLSYLYLAKFPKLQTTLRQCAAETQQLFVFSEVILMKCVDTSKQMVSWLLPELKLAVETNDTDLTELMLKEAKECIAEVVGKVKEIVDRYEKHAHGVGSCASDVIKEKAEAGNKTTEIETLEKVVNDLLMELRKTLEEIGRIETQIAQRHHFRLSKEASSRMLDLSLLLFVGVIKPFSRPFFNQRAELLDQWSILKSQQHNIQARLTDAQLNLTNMKAQNGLKNITHLSEVHKWLYQIQQSLIQHNVFWKSVQVILEAINDETFAKEHFIGDSELKEIFLTNIDSAQEHWKAFGESCLKALNIYSLQDKDAYKFLDRSSSFLPDTIDEEINILDPRVPLHPRFYNL